MRYSLIPALVLSLAHITFVKVYAEDLDTLMDTSRPAPHDSSVIDTVSTASPAGPAEPVPSLDAALGLSLIGTFPFAPLGGVGWGLSYAGAKREAKIAGRLQATGYWTAGLGSLGVLGYCFLGARDEPGCTISKVVGSLGLATAIAGTGYGFISLPGAVDRARVRAGYPSRLAGPGRMPTPKDTAGLAAERDSVRAGASGSAASAPRVVDTERAEPSPAKSVFLAYPLMAGATLIPVMVATNLSPGAAVGVVGTGLLLGPSAGQFYAGSPKQAWLGVGIRAAAVPVAVAAHALWPDNIVPGAAVLLGGTAYSLVDTYFAVNRFNERSAKGSHANDRARKAATVRTSLAPTLFPVAEGRFAPGLAFNASF